MRRHQPDDTTKLLTPSMARLLWVAGLLVFLAGVQLFVFSERTDEYFAWTVDPPLTAAFLGASYWASVAFEWSAARRRRWADARIAVPTVFVFTTLTLVVTLVHLDRFHLGPSFGAATRAVTWAWLAIYATVPVLLAALWAIQARRPGGDGLQGPPLPRWLRASAALQGGVLVAFGGWLLVAPADAADLWPWTLTPLTARATGAWLVSLGVAALHGYVENDAHRLRPAAHAYLVFGVLQFVALARYPETVDWTDARASVYVAFLVVALGTGVGTLVVDRRQRRSGTALRGVAIEARDEPVDIRAGDRAVLGDDREVVSGGAATGRGSAPPAARWWGR